MNIFELIRIYNSMRSYFEANYHASLSSISTLMGDGASSVIRKLVADNNKKTADRTYEENVAEAVSQFKLRFDTLMESERRRMNDDPDANPTLKPEVKQEEDEEKPVYIVDKVDSYWFNKALEDCYRECLRKDPSLKGIKKEDYEQFNLQWDNKIGHKMKLKYSQSVPYLPRLSKEDQADIDYIDMVSGWDDKLLDYKKKLTQYTKDIDEQEITGSAAVIDKLHTDIEAFLRRVDALHARVDEMNHLPDKLRDQKFIDDVETVSKEAEEIVRERQELSERTRAALDAVKDEKKLDDAVSDVRTLTEDLTTMHTEVSGQLEKYPEDIWLGQLSADTQQLQTISSRILELKQRDLKTNQTILADQKQFGNDATAAKIGTINNDLGSLRSWVKNQSTYVAYQQEKKVRDEKEDLDREEDIKHHQRIEHHRRLREAIDCILDTTAYGKHHGVNHPEYARMLEAVQQYRSIAKEEMLDHPTPEQKQAMNNAYRACKDYLEVHLKRDSKGKASLGGQKYTVGKLRKQAAVCMYECFIKIGADPVEEETQPTRAYKKRHITRDDLDSLKESLEASAMDYRDQRRGDTIFDEKAYANLEYVRRDHLQVYEKLVDPQRVKNDAKNIKKRTHDEEGVKMAGRLRKTLPKLKLPKNKEQCMAELDEIEKICAESAYYDYKGYYKRHVVKLMDNYYKVKADPSAYTEAMFDQLIETNDELYMTVRPLRKNNNRSLRNFKARVEELWAYVQEIKVLNQDPKSFHYGASNEAWSQFVPAYEEYLETSQKEKDIPDAHIDIHGKVIEEIVEEPAREERAADNLEPAKGALAAANKNPLHNSLYALVVAGKWSADNKQLPDNMEQVNRSALSYYNAKAADKQECLNHLYSTCINYLEAAPEHTDEAAVCRQAVSGLVQTVYRQRSAFPEFNMAATHYEDTVRLSGKEPTVPKAVNNEDAVKKLKELTSSYKDFLQKAEGQPTHGKQNANVNNKGRASLPADGGHCPAKG